MQATKISTFSDPPLSFSNKEHQICVKRIKIWYQVNIFVVFHHLQKVWTCSDQRWADIFFYFYELPKCLLTWHSAMAICFNRSGPKKWLRRTGLVRTGLAWLESSAGNGFCGISPKILLLQNYKWLQPQVPGDIVLWKISWLNTDFVMKTNTKVSQLRSYYFVISCCWLTLPLFSLIYVLLWYYLTLHG